MKNKSYDKAFKELNEILEELQSDELSIDGIATKAKKAKELITFCRTRLREIEQEVQETDED